MKILILTIAAVTLAVPGIARDYRFTVKYEFGDVTAKISRQETAVALLSVKAPDTHVLFKQATIANGSEAPQELPYMAGIQFDAGAGSRTFQPDFFKNFPAEAFEARNLVWDTVMFLSFSQVKFTSVNQTRSFAQNDAIDLAGSGKFTNKDVELTWSGYGEHNGERCVLIDYRAFQNPLTIKAGTNEMHGRSDYWGQIWVSPSGHEIEYGTLFEDVVMQMAVPGQPAPMVVDVFRSATFEALPNR